MKKLISLALIVIYALCMTVNCFADNDVIDETIEDAWALMDSEDY